MPGITESEGLDHEWLDKFNAAQRKAQIQFTLQSTVAGYLTGQTVGTAGYILQTRRAGIPALGAGAFLGVCLGVGAAMRSM